MRSKQTHDILATIFIICAIILVAILCFTSCKSQTVYVPVETIKTEYIEKVKRDSIHLYDSVYVDRWKANDTVFVTKEKYRYLYKDVLIHDSIFFTDSIQVPYPVVETVVKKAPYTWYEKALLALGLICIGIIGFRIYKFIRK